MQESVILTQLKEVPYVVHLVKYISGHSPDCEHAAPRLHLEFVEGCTLEKKIELWSMVGPRTYTLCSGRILTTIL